MPQMPHPKQLEYEDAAAKLEEQIAKKQQELDEKRRIASTFKVPRQNTDIPLDPQTAIVAVLNLIRNRINPSARQGSANMQGFIEGRQRQNQAAYGNEVNQYNEQQRQAELEREMAADEIGRLEKRRGEVISEGRYREGVKFRDRQAKGSALRSLGSVRDEVDLDATVLGLKEEGIDVDPVAVEKIRGKLQAGLLKEAQEAAKKAAAAENEKLSNDFNGGLRAAVSAANATTDGWTAANANEWAKRRLQYKERGIDGMKLDPVPVPGRTTLAKQARMDAQENETYRRGRDTKQDEQKERERLENANKDNLKAWQEELKEWKADQDKKGEAFKATRTELQGIDGAIRDLNRKLGEEEKGSTRAKELQKELDKKEVERQTAFRKHREAEKEWNEAKKQKAPEKPKPVTAATMPVKITASNMPKDWTPGGKEDTDFKKAMNAISKGAPKDQVIALYEKETGRKWPGG